MKAMHWISACAVLAVAACGEPTADKSDVPDVAEEAPLSSNDLGNTYPSQTGVQTPISPGAEGGTSSAATGATDPGQAPDASSQQQRTTP